MIKHSKPIIVALLGAFLLAACATGPIGPKERLAQSCSAWGTVLWTLVIQRNQGNLSPDQVAAISHMVPVADAICSEGTPTEDDLTTLDQLVAALTAIQDANHAALAPKPKPPATAPATPDGG